MIQFKVIRENQVSVVTFSEIPEEGLVLQFNDSSWTPKGITCQGSSSAELFLEKKDSRVILNGKFTVVVVLNCDRCLEEFNFKLANSFVVDFELGNQSDTDVEDREYQYDKSETDTIFLSKPEIDINKIMRQQVLLSLPMKKLCDDSCRGLCAKCGANLNEGPEACTCTKESTSPFGVLANLKK